jgi:hypothetical protein
MGRPSGQAAAYFKTVREAKAVAKLMHKRNLGTSVQKIHQVLKGPLAQIRVACERYH